MVQGTFDDLGTPLSSVTFVVVDLETTGGSPAECGITEIGAVKVRGGEVRRRVPDPGQPRRRHPGRSSRCSPASPTRWSPAPRASRRPCPRSSSSPRGVGARRPQRRLRHRVPQGRGRGAPSTRGPASPVLDTVHLARQLVHRDEVPNHKLASLAVLFRATTTPDHRALHDARATVDVLHGLLERVGSLGVHSLEELLDYTSRVTPAQRRKRHLADDLPDAARRLPVPGRPGPGALRRHVGRRIRTRVRSYFTASEHRSRMGEMVRIAESVEPDRLRHHARGRGARAAADRRAQAALQPPLAQPRARAVGQAHRRAVPPAVDRARRRATTAPATSARSARARPPRRRWPRCTRCSRCASALERLSPTKPRSAVRAGRDGPVRRPVHRRAVASPTTPLRRRPRRRPARRRHPRPRSTRLRARMTRLADAERFEDAQVVRDRLRRPGARHARARSGSPRWPRIPELVAARRIAARRLGGRLRPARPARRHAPPSPRGADPMPYVEALRASAEVVAAPLAPCAGRHAPRRPRRSCAGSSRPGVRIVEVEGAWTCPVGGAGAGAGRARAARGRPARGRRLRRRALTAGAGPAGTSTRPSSTAPRG